MLQAIGVTRLEYGIVRPRCTQVDHLLVGVYSLVELTSVELAVAYAVQRIGIRGLVLIDTTYIVLQRSSSLYVHPLLEIRIAFQV